MSENFDNLNAPQFYDFNKDLYEDQNADSYFETDHENIELRDPLEDPLKFGSSEEDHNKIILDNNNDYDKSNSRKPRRSLSMGDLLNDYVEDRKVENTKDGTLTSEFNKNTAIYTSFNNLSKANGNTSLNKRKMYPTGSAQRLTKAVSKENLNRLAQPKKYGSAKNLNQNKYVSMAEAVRKFHSGTPTRFRTRPIMSKLEITVPQTPALLSKNRNRPVSAISIEERERLEYEEAQKFKIKAKPLNKKILQGPIPLVPIEKKPSTIVKPFNITEAPQKTAVCPTEGFKFCAKPVPKFVYESPKLKVVQKTKSLDYIKGPVRPPRKHQEEPKPNVKLGRTIPEPFSFEERDQQMFKKKEEFIKKFIEEEKKAAEFHARPIPKVILKSAKSNSSLKRSDPSDINCELTKSEENVSSQFKARPATILKKKPFKPRKEDRQLTEISEFQLNTERRAKEREEFEQYRREKEERITLVQQQEEEIRLQREKEEVSRLRKDMEYKAKPIKKYKEIIIQPSGIVTKPIAPFFYTDSKNKENLL